MDNIDEELLHSFIALQQFLATINYVCGMAMVSIHAILESINCNLDVERSPNPYQTQLDHLNRIVLNENNCNDQLRLTRHAFMCLCTLVPCLGLGDSKYVVLEEKVIMFLTIVGHDEKNCVVKFNFFRSSQTVSKFFHDVLNAILCLHVVLLKTPELIIANCTDNI